MEILWSDKLATKNIFQHQESEGMQPYTW